MARPVVHASNAATVLSGVGLLVAVAVGSWWIADAVVSGAIGAVMLRFGATVGMAFYYLVLLRVATGRTLRPRWQADGHY